MIIMIFDYQPSPYEAGWMLGRLSVLRAEEREKNTKEEKALLTRREEIKLVILIT